MAKRKAGSPLQFLCVNEPLRATRSSSRLKNISKWPHGKENENVREEGTPSESSLKVSEIRPAEASSSKRSRLGVAASRNSDAPRGHNKKRPPEECSLSESKISTFRKDNSTAERPLGDQSTKCLGIVDGHCEGTFQNEHDFTEFTPVHSRGPDELNCCHTRTKRGKSSTRTGASPSRPVSEEREISSRNRSLLFTTHHESTVEGKGSNEDDTVMYRDEKKGKESAQLPVQPNSICRDQGHIDQIGDNRVCSEDQGLRLTSDHRHSPLLEEPVRRKVIDITENSCEDNVRDHITSSKTENIVPVNMRNNRDSDGKEKTLGVLDGTVQGNGQGCHNCSPVAWPDLDAEAALQVLEEAYKKLYQKYQRLETKNMAEVEAVYDEQTRRFAAFTTAADGVVEKLREENEYLVRQLQERGVEESVNRSRELEEELIECKNELVMERSKVLELERELRGAHLCILELRTSMRPVANSTPCVPAQQSRDLEASQVANTTVKIAHRIQSVDLENLRLKSHSTLLQEQNEIAKNTALGVDSPSFEESPAEGSLRDVEEKETEVCARQPDLETFGTGLGGNKLLNGLLESLAQMSTVVDKNLCQITFTHDDSGFSFKLEQNELSREVGGDDALLYQVISPGTIVRLGPAWLQSEIVFDISQAPSFFERILAVTRGCPPH